MLVNSYSWFQIVCILGVRSFRNTDKLNTDPKLRDLDIRFMTNTKTGDEELFSSSPVSYY